MRPGRLPVSHPDEQKARQRLRSTTVVVETSPQGEPVVRTAPQQQRRTEPLPRRWGMRG